ncbi:MAG: ATP-binding protein [Anaeroplasmataceae bacterium]|nr:ATP-binding protein [Anaeroplasmataceae bacterium]
MKGLEELLQNLENCFINQDYSSKYLKRLKIVVDEIAGNIVRYAYSPNEGEMELRLKLKRHSISLCFVDSGMPYNPLLQSEPDIELSLEDRTSGGLGIYMVRKFVDRIKYKRKNYQNYLFLRLNIF